MALHWSWTARCRSRPAEARGPPALTGLGFVASRELLLLHFDEPTTRHAARSAALLLGAEEPLRPLTALALRLLAWLPMPEYDLDESPGEMPPWVNSADALRAYLDGERRVAPRSEPEPVAWLRKPRALVAVRRSPVRPTQGELLALRARFGPGGLQAALADAWPARAEATVALAHSERGQQLERAAGALCARCGAPLEEASDFWCSPACEGGRCSCGAELSLGTRAAPWAATSARRALLREEAAALRADLARSGVAQAFDAREFEHWKKADACACRWAKGGCAECRARLLEGEELLRLRRELCGAEARLEEIEADLALPELLVELHSCPRC